MGNDTTQPEIKLEIPFRVVKKLIAKELAEHIAEAKRILRKNAFADVQQNLAHIAENVLSPMLERCETLEQLEDFMGEANYRMSVQDWINSL